MYIYNSNMRRETQTPEADHLCTVYIVYHKATCVTYAQAPGADLKFGVKHILYNRHFCISYFF